MKNIKSFVISVCSFILLFSTVYYIPSYAYTYYVQPITESDGEITTVEIKTGEEEDTESEVIVAENEIEDETEDEIAESEDDDNVSEIILDDISIQDDTDESEESSDNSGFTIEECSFSFSYVTQSSGSDYTTYYTTDSDGNLQSHTTYTGGKTYYNTIEAAAVDVYQFQDIFESMPYNGTVVGAYTTTLYKSTKYVYLYGDLLDHSLYRLFWCDGKEMWLADVTYWTNSDGDVSYATYYDEGYTMVVVRVDDTVSYSTINVRMDAKTYQPSSSSDSTSSINTTFLLIALLLLMIAFFFVIASSHY